MDFKIAAEEVLHPLEMYRHQCHAASIKLVKAGVGDRVARGMASGVGGQHSWVVVGDPYNPAVIIDPTLWSYREDVDGVLVLDVANDDNLGQYLHTPHGEGSIWDWGKPAPPTGEVITLPGELSRTATMFLDMLGPLDMRGWLTLASVAPVEGWPAGEIYEAMQQVEELAVLVPIDRLGMLTDINPGGLYLKGEEKCVKVEKSAK